MTEAEMTYLTSMEEVKTISKRLVVAEKAFAWVRDRIQKLVAKYETLLVKIESDSAVGGAPSSVLTSGTSYYSDDDNSQYSSDDDREKVMLTRRARRAELRAEVAAREAYLAKQEAQMVREEKQRELEVLQVICRRAFRLSLLSYIRLTRLFTYHSKNLQKCRKSHQLPLLRKRSPFSSQRQLPMRHRPPFSSAAVLPGLASRGSMT